MATILFVNFPSYLKVLIIKQLFSKTCCRQNFRAVGQICLEHIVYSCWQSWKWVHSASDVTSIFLGKIYFLLICYICASLLATYLQPKLSWFRMQLVLINNFPILLPSYNFTLVKILQEIDNIVNLSYTFFRCMAILDKTRQSWQPTQDNMQ